MVDPQNDMVVVIRETALKTMAERGVDGTSVQMVADAAGCAKSNVLYHFGSKQRLVEAALTPAVEELARLTDRVEQFVADGGSVDDPDVAAWFVDALLEHRLAANLVVNRMGELPEGQFLERLRGNMSRMGAVLTASQSAEDSLRIQIVIGGLAYALAYPDGFWPDDSLPDMRRALLKITRELLVSRPGGEAQ